MYTPTKKELGAAAGLEVGCSSVAVIDAGEGKAALDDLVKKLAALKKAA